MMIMRQWRRSNKKRKEPAALDYEKHGIASITKEYVRFGPDITKSR